MRQVGRYRALHGVASSIGWGSALGRRRGASTPPVVRPNQVARTALYVVSTIHTVASGAFLPPLPKRCRAGGRPGKPVQRCEIRPSCWPHRARTPKPPNPYRHQAGMPTGETRTPGGGPSPSPRFLFRYSYSRRSSRPRCAASVEYIEHRNGERSPKVQRLAARSVSHLLPSDV